jgi:hypothetical protein
VADAESRGSTTDKADHIVWAAEAVAVFPRHHADHAAKETRDKIELFEWADSVLGLGEAELEVALDDAVKRFGRPRVTLKRIIAARRSEKSKAKAQAERNRAEPKDDDKTFKYYSPDFKVSDRGVFVRKFDNKGSLPVTPWRSRSCAS